MSADRLYALIGAALTVAAFLLGRYAWPSRRALELAMTRSGPAGDICGDCGGWCQPCDCCLTDLQEMDNDGPIAVAPPAVAGPRRADVEFDPVRVSPDVMDRAAWSDADDGPRTGDIRPDGWLIDLQEMEEWTGETTIPAVQTTSPMALASGAEPAAENRTAQIAARDLWSEPLSPSQERAAHALDLPGPASVIQRGRAGEPQEPPLPAILHLGQEGDGTEDTYARVWFAQRKMLNDFKREQAALMASCGLTYRGLVAA